MRQKRFGAGFTGLVLIGIYVLFALAFLIVGRDQIHYTSEKTCLLASAPEKDLGELTEGTQIEQLVQSESQYIRGVTAYFLTYGRENEGRVAAAVFDPSTGEILAESSLEARAIGNGQWQTFTLDRSVDTYELPDRQVGIRFTFPEGREGSAVTMTTEGKAEGKFTIRGEEVQGRSLCAGLIQYDHSGLAIWYYVGALLLLLLMLGYYFVSRSKEKRGKLTAGAKYMRTFERYRFLLEQLVSRDFKTKYKRSVLGVFWSFLNPLLTMSVQYTVFSRLFRFNVPAYPVYLLTGIVLFNFFSEGTTQAMNAITGNASLITKVYVPKYIYPISKVLSTSINLLFSMIPLVLVALIMGRGITWNYLMLPFGIVCFLLFVIGISFFLATAMVFFRDMQFLWGVFTMMWMYATPVIYPIDILEGTFLFPLQKINPLYHYITFFRTIIVNQSCPSPRKFLVCALFALLALLVGGLIFKKAQDDFVLHI